MLNRLVISNYALIDELSVTFGPGFTILTGETGAGKSIILGAMSLILGARADFSSMRNPDKKCIVEGYFNLEGRDLQPFFAANDLDYDPVSILRREITSSGKSRAFVNDTPVTLQLLRELTLRLIDIHSQHQNLELNTQQFQLQLVDTVAQSEEAVKSYQSVYREFNTALQALTALKEKASRSRADLDYLTFQFRQLEDARLVEGEQESLEDERNRLTHAEEIKGALVKVAELLRGDHFPVVSRLKESVTLMEKAGAFLKEATELHQRLQSSYIELADLAHETERLAEKTENDPHRLEEISLRLDLIYSLEQKHQLPTVEALIALKEDLDARIGEITGYDEEITVAETRVTTLEAQMKHAAARLSALRKKVFPGIEANVAGVLRQLAIPHARFIVEHETRTSFTPSGADNIQFLFSANRDTIPAEISKIASGGEISRLMLALKTLVSGSKMLSTIIFDEIDAGISGETALKMGVILKQLSAGIQVINITHLPQIAGKGDHHFLVYKVDNESGTFTSIRKLSGEERVEEMARMVGGDRPTDNARKAAREMLQ